MIYGYIDIMIYTLYFPFSFYNFLMQSKYEDAISNNINCIIT